MGTDVLALSSLAALLIRLAGILIFLGLAVIQYREIKSPRTLRPLAKLLFYFFVMIALSSMPLLWLNYIRVLGHLASNDVTSFSTVTNAISFLGAAVLFLLIRQYKGPSDDE